MKVFAVQLLLASFSSATSFTLDLTTGTASTSLPPGVTWYRSLSGSGTCGKYGTLKIDMTGRNMVKFDFNFGTKSGWLFNIGDSSTNNGYGGDAGTQSRDCEAHVKGSQFEVYRNDEQPGLAYSASGVVDDKFTVWVKDGFISWFNFDNEFNALFDTNFYYALNDQSDFEGSPNKDIYLGLNQVVNGQSNRRGSGLCNVTVTIT